MKNIFKSLFALLLATVCFSSAWAQVDFGNPAAPSYQTAPSTSAGGTSTNDVSCKAIGGSLGSLDEDRNTFLGTYLSRLIGGEGGSGSKLIAIGSSIASANVMPIAKNLGGILAVISLLFAAVYAVLNGESIAGSVFEVLIKAAVIGGVLSQYDTLVVSGFTQLQGAMNNLSSSGGGGVGAGPGTILADFLTKVLTSLYMPFKTGYEAMSCSGIFEFKFGVLIEVLATAAILILGVFLLMGALLEAIFGLLAGPFILAVAIAVGPLSIACAVSGVTSSMFEKWLGFALNGAIMTGIAGIVLKIFSLSMISTANDQNVGLISVAIVNLVNVLIAGKLFAHIPDYAAALTGASGFRSGGSGKKAAQAGLGAGFAMAGAGMAAKSALGSAGGAGAAAAAVGAAKGYSAGAQRAAATAAAASQLSRSAVSGLKNAAGLKK